MWNSRSYCWSGSRSYCSVRCGTVGLLVRQVVLQGRVRNNSSYSRSTRSTGCNRENFGVWGGGGGTFCRAPGLAKSGYFSFTYITFKQTKHTINLFNFNIILNSVGQVVLQGRVGNSRSYCLSHSHGRVGCGTGGHNVGQAVG